MFTGPCQAAILEVMTRVLGEEHPDTLTAMQNLGGSLRRSVRDLPKILQRNLNLPSRGGRRQLSGISGIERRAQTSEVRMVRQIERLRPKLQPVALADLKILEHREVRADQTGLSEDVAAGVAPFARSGVLECRRIEPLLAMLARRRL